MYMYIDIFCKSSVCLQTFSSYRSSEIKALNNMSLNIYPGELTVILGHNGAGKSTLMNILTGKLVLYKNRMTQ